MEWKDRKMVSATVRNVSGNGACEVSYGGKVVTLKIEPGKLISLDGSMGLVTSPDQGR